MLNETQSLLERQSRKIPGLAMLFETEQLATFIASRCEADAKSLQLEPYYIRFKPNSSCLIGFAAHHGNEAFQFHAKALSFDNAHKLKKDHARPVVSAQFQHGKLINDAQLLSIWFHPNDPELRALRKIYPRHPGMRPLAYKPQRRFVGLHEAENRPNEVFKMYTADSYIDACRLARIAHRIEVLPDLLSVSSRHKLLRLRWQAGVTLSEHIINSNSSLESDCELAAQLLARLHQSPPMDPLPVQSVRQDLQRVRTISSGLELLLPDLTPQVQQLTTQFQRVLSRCRRDSVLSHGDFYSNQVILDSASSRLLDFDALCLAPPAADIGLFLAHLRFDVLRHRLSVARCDQLANCFVKAYRAQCEIDDFSIEAYTLHGMYQLAHRPFRDRMDHWPECIRGWIAEIEQRLALLQPLSMHVAPSFPGVSTQSPVPPELNTAMDPNVAFPLLERMLMSSDEPLLNPQVQSVELQRHKTGRRALLNYCVHDHNDSPRRIMGKVRFKGLDISTYEFNQRIHQLTRNQAQAPLAVPVPLGLIPELNMWVQEHIDATTGWKCLELPTASHHAFEVAHALFLFHSLPLGSGREHGIGKELRILETRLQQLSDSRKQLKERLARLYQNCRSISERLTDRSRAQLHRDFYPDQILLREGSVFFLDLDLHCIGDPALDLGNFVAHIQERDLRLYGNPLLHQSFTQTFLRSYFSRSDDPALPQAAEIYRLLSLARLISISDVIAARRPYTEAILEYCECGLRRFSTLPRP